MIVGPVLNVSKSVKIYKNYLFLSKFPATLLMTTMCITPVTINSPSHFTDTLYFIFPMTRNRNTIFGSKKKSTQLNFIDNIV